MFIMKGQSWDITMIKFHKVPLIVMHIIKKEIQTLFVPFFIFY